MEKSNNNIKKITTTMYQYKNTIMFSSVSLFFLVLYVGTIGKIFMVSTSFQLVVLALILITHLICAIKIFLLEKRAIKSELELDLDLEE